MDGWVRRPLAQRPGTREGACASARTGGRWSTNERSISNVAVRRSRSAGGTVPSPRWLYRLRSRLSNRRVSTDPHRVGCLRRARYHLSPRSRQALPPSSGKKTGSPQPVFQHKNWKLTASFPVKNRKPPQGGGRRRPGRRLARWRRTRPGRRDGGAGRCAAGSGRAGASPAVHTGSQERVVGPVPCLVRSGNKR